MRRTLLIAAGAAALLAGCAGGSGTSDRATGGGAVTPGSTATSGGSGPSAGPGTTRAPNAAAAAYTSEIYSDPKHWLCRPGAAANVCDENLDVTDVAPDGTLSVEKFAKATDPGIDCFYVYPTISSDPGFLADLDADASSTEAGAVRNQAARLGSVCRMYAPVYRQVTLAGLFGRATGDRAGGMDTAYGDVLDAWKHYLANDNDGRGVILVAHSQGSGHLGRLLREEIDPQPEERARIVGAYLLGSSVMVPEAGATVGGDLQNMPLCTASDETGCVVTFASFRSTAPPPENSFFGRPRAGGGVSGCVNPAALVAGTDGADTELHNVFPKSAPVLNDPAADAKITTKYVSLTGMVSGQCVNEGGFSFLKVTVHDDPADARVDDIGGDLTPEWGLHLVDANLVMNDLVALAERQAAAYLGR
jgi:hypothetical protein